MVYCNANMEDLQAAVHFTVAFLGFAALDSAQDNLILRIVLPHTLKDCILFVSDILRSLGKGSIHHQLAMLMVDSDCILHG